MSNGIAKRQNEEKYVNHLAAQRQLYNEVKLWDNMNMMLSVVLPLALAVSQILFKNIDILKSLSYLLSLMSMLFAAFLDNCVSKKKKLAAEIQQHFDVYVYQMPWDKKLFGSEKNIINSVAEKSEKLLKKNGEKQKLLNWYTKVADGLELNKGILVCQKENFHWDVNLRKNYKKASISIITFLILIIFGIGIYENEPFITILYRITFIAPMLRWLISAIKQLNTDINNLMELDQMINSPEEKEIEELQEIQAKLYNHRKTCLAIPNFFYKWNKKNDEVVAYRTAKMDTEK